MCFSLSRPFLAYRLCLAWHSPRIEARSLLLQDCTLFPWSKCIPLPLLYDHVISTYTHIWKPSPAFLKLLKKHQLVVPGGAVSAFLLRDINKSSRKMRSLPWKLVTLIFVLVHVECNSVRLWRWIATSTHFISLMCRRACSYGQVAARGAASSPEASTIHQALCESYAVL